MGYRNWSLTIFALVALLFGSGCQEIYLADDVDLELDFFQLTVSDELHTPYVEGAVVSISVQSSDDGDPTESWILESADPSVLRIDSQENGRAKCKATGSGVTTMMVYDESGGELLHEAEIVVRQPTRVELYPHGPEIIGQPVVENQPLILRGGTATFLVRYFDGDQLLHGNGALTAFSTGSAQVNPEQTFLFENREWLQITPNTVGPESISLQANGFTISKLPLTVVEKEDLTSMQILSEDISDAEEGQLVTVLAQAYNYGDLPVYGVEFSWDLDGDGEPGLGDLFRYGHQPGAWSTLGAELDGLRSETIIQADHGYVDSSNRLGCTTRPGRSGSSQAWPVLAVLLVLASRRRRQRA